MKARGKRISDSPTQYEPLREANTSSGDLDCSGPPELPTTDETAAAALLQKEREASVRETLLNGNSRWEMWADSVVSNGSSFCSTCFTSSDDAYRPNIERLWLGIGEEEHCRDCGAFAVRHSRNYRDISRRSVSQLVADIAAVEAVYSSPVFMTEEQTKQNRDYFSRLLSTASAKDPDHERNRYETRVFRRHREALFDYLIELATRMYGDRQKALEVYGDVSREFDHIYFFIDEVKNSPGVNT